MKEDKWIDGVMNLGKYGHNSPRDMHTDANFCIEQSRNTWWNNTNFDFIRTKVGIIRVTSDVSQQWIEETSKMFCSLCDGGVGIGKLTGICPLQWDSWYNSCKNDFFTADVRASELGAGEITFCNKNSLLCSNLKDIYSDSTTFCKQMGIPVNDNKGECYDGVPWQVKEGFAKKDKKPKDKTKPTRQRSPKATTWYEQLFQQSLEYYDQYPKTFLCIYCSLLGFSLIHLTRIILGFIHHKKGEEYIDDDLKEKRRKLMEKRARKAEAKAENKATS